MPKKVIVPPSQIGRPKSKEQLQTTSINVTDMNNELKKLAPQSMWSYFAEICDIPRPSYHEEKMRNYLVEFAAAHNLWCTVDEGKNVIIRKPATAGMENRKPIVLQAHCDMVPQKNSDKQFDFTTDAIEPYIDGEWVTADGTTLGADNGMGIASILAVLSDNSLAHGDIEALFTATEETGMEGAFGLLPDELKGEILLNLDSETEGELYVGCAGGLDFNITLPYSTGYLPKEDFAGYRLELKGLKGGHSGMEIILQRANANKIMARFLKLAQEKLNVLICDIDGGGLRNAIPRESFSTVVVVKRHERKFLTAVKKFEATINDEFAGIEDNISFKAVAVKCPTKCIDLFDQCYLIDAVVACTNGIVKMSPSIAGLVQTSTNLARVVSEKGRFHVSGLIRSSVRSEKEFVGTMIRSVFEMAGGKVKLDGEYDGWNPNPDSPILHLMKASYKQMFGTEAKVMAIHAGLECGVIGGKYPKMDMISFGPTICYPHSPDEKVNIESVGKFYKFLCHTIENIPQK